MDSELYLGKLNHCWEDHCRDMVCASAKFKIPVLSLYNNKNLHVTSSCNIQLQLPMQQSSRNVSLPNLKPRGAGYESVCYVINKTRPTNSERAG